MGDPLSNVARWVKAAVLRPVASSHSIPTFFALGAFILMPVSFVEAQVRLGGIAPAPPQPVGATVKARRGEVLEIPLRIFGTRTQALTFLIRTPPRAGKLSAPKNTANETAIVRYTPPADRAVTRDSFTYAVRSVDGVSAPVEVVIEIADTPAELIAPGELSFGKRLVGKTETVTLEIQNRGGDVSEGDVTVDSPWRVEPPAHYRVEGNARAFLRVTFAPDLPGEFSGEVHYSGQPARLTTLRGEAIAPLAVRPAALDLHHESVTGARTGVFEIANQTDSERVVSLHATERLKMDRRLTIAPGRSATVAVMTAEDDRDALAEVIRFEAQGFSAVLPVRAAAVAPPDRVAVIAPAPSPAKHAPAEPARVRPAAVRAAPAEPDPEPAPPSADVLAARWTHVLEVTASSATIEWPQLTKQHTYRAETRELSLRDKQLDVTWRPFANFATSDAGKMTRGVFTGLAPGHAYTFRVLAAGSDEPVAMSSLITRPTPPRAPWITLPRVLVVLLLGVLGGALYQRVRAASTGL